MNVEAAARKMGDEFDWSSETTLAKLENGVSNDAQSSGTSRSRRANMLGKCNEAAHTRISARRPLAGNMAMASAKQKAEASAMFPRYSLCSFVHLIESLAMIMRKTMSKIVTVMRGTQSHLMSLSNQSRSGVHAKTKDAATIIGNA